LPWWEGNWQAQQSLGEIMNRSNKYPDFACAIVDFQRVITVPLAERQTSPARWRVACAALIPNDRVMGDKLAQRLGMKAGATYGNGATSFLSLLRSHMSRPPDHAGWSLR
jgi:hypothetical protein